MTCNKSQFFLWRCFNIKQELPINGQIREKEVQLIGVNGEKLGIVSTREALEKAGENNLDLVLVAPNSKPVVCKIMNYGKYKFEQANSKAGENVLNKFIEKLEDVATVEKKPKLEGRNMFTILAKKV